jgi:ABC-type dipeptide/oligopeptide/nickel transport system permease component
VVAVSLPVIAMVFVVGNLLVDLCYGWLDPRVNARS